MKKQYDFSKAKRGIFYNPDARFNIPVYLDKDVQKFIDQIARRKKKDPSAIVNQILKTDMALADSIR
jgi:retron-type reverse transcriptase